MLVIYKLKRSLSSGFSATLAANLGIVVLNSVSGIMVARLLGPEGRGEFAAAVVWTAIVSIIVQIALPQALTYYTAREPEAVGNIFITTCAIWIIQSLAAVLIGQVMISLVLSQAQPQILDITRMYLISAPFMMLSTYISTIAQGLKRFQLFSAVRLSGSLPYFLSALAGSFFQVNNAYTLLLMMLVLQVLVSFGAVLVFWLKIRPSGHVQLALARNLLKYGFKSYWGSLSWMANSRLDQLIMSVLVSLDDLGQYSVAVAYAGILFPVAGAFAMMLFPSVSSASDADGRREIWRTLKMNLSITALGIVFLGIAGPVVIPLLFGESFTAAVSPALVLLVGTVLLGSNYVLSDGLRGLGFPLQPSLAEIIGTVVTVIGLIVFVPMFGIMGAAYVSVLSYGSVTITLLAFLVHNSSMAGARFSDTS
jgi:O-antigen/teichoic acid export membrane protein